MNQKDIGLKALIILSMVSFLISCKSPENIHSSDLQEGKTAETPRILFIDYQLTRDSARANYTAQLVSMIVRDGKIKETLKSNSQAEKGDLELLVLDGNQQIMTQHIIPNPLDRSVEFVNDAGQLGHKMIHLDSAQFNVRLRIEPGASFLLLNRYTGIANEGILLLKTSIQ
jgi:hypothetical protein